MYFAATLSVVQCILAVVQCPQLKEICSILGYESELDHLSNTVCAVKAVLIDANGKQELPVEAQLWLQELRDAVYEADDLLDEFVTLSEQRNLVEDGKVSGEVRVFFSRFNPLIVADNLSEWVKKIRGKYDTIASSQSHLGFSADCLPVRRREEKGSYVYTDDIIGREDDLAKIVSMLLDSTVQQDVSFLSIVGTGGVGKTALARLVYNDQRVARAFPLKMWACVSDQDQKEFDVNEVLGKIVRSTIEHKVVGFSYTIEEMIRDLLEQIAGRKYLLVLDDVWTENHDQWLKLVEVLMVGRRGSWIVVTTRSRETAKAISNGPMFEIHGLSEENSWRLFEKTAFEEAAAPDDLVKIGREIVKACNAVPLAIRVVGSLLYGQDKSKWRFFQETLLAEIRQGENGIEAVLKLSYHHLESGMQSCFSYCALFSKDFEIYKDFLSSLWISQGFLVPLHEGQSIEDAAEEYFSILLRRCFFQDVKRDEFGEVVSCKMHDLIHDIAQEIAGEEISGVSSVKSCLHNKVRHLSGAKDKSRQIFFSAETHIRTYFQVDGMDQLPMGQLLETCNCLRALILRDSGIKNLPESIGKLLHLRCLDLSDNSCLELLPSSITNLHNLQTLKLKSCINLKEVPKGLSKLVKLMVLDIDQCYRLTYIPPDLRKLTCLHTLSDFVACVASSSSEQCVDQLEGLKGLENLRGHLCIKIYFAKNAAYAKQDGSKGAYLRSKKHLKHVRFDIEHREGDARGDDEVALLEDLQPHSNLRGLVFFGYRSMNLPSWAKQDNLITFLPNLVRLEFGNCTKLQNLPWLRNLHHLKFLSISDLPNLEYMENDPVDSRTGSCAERLSFFPCLEEFRLFRLPKLKGWCRDVAMGGDKFVSSSRRSKKLHLSPSSSLHLPEMKTLYIGECPELASILLCPRVEDLNLRIFNKKLKINMTNKGDDENVEAATSSISCSSLSLSDSRISTHPMLRSVITDNMLWFKSLPTEAFQCLTHICVFWDKELESLSDVEEIFRSCSSSLQSLEICHCPKLSSLSGGLKHLTVLETLVLENIANLLLTSSKEDKGEGDGMPWRSLHQSLRSLELLELPKLVKLPKEMQYLSALRCLKIRDCEQLQLLPKWIRELTSLRQLEVHGCTCLYQRCQDPTEEDWPNIEHIPN